MNEIKATIQKEASVPVFSIDNVSDDLVASTIIDEAREVETMEVFMPVRNITQEIKEQPSFAPAVLPGELDKELIPVTVEKANTPCLECEEAEKKKKQKQWLIIGAVVAVLLLVLALLIRKK